MGELTHSITETITSNGTRVGDIAAQKPKEGKMEALADGSIKFIEGYIPKNYEGDNERYLKYSPNSKFGPLWINIGYNTGEHRPGYKTSITFELGGNSAEDPSPGKLKESIAHPEIYDSPLPSDEDFEYDFKPGSKFSTLLGKDEKTRAENLGETAETIASLLQNNFTIKQIEEYFKLNENTD